MIGRRLRCVFVLLLLSVSGLASAQISLYEQENFGGRVFRAGGTVPNLDETGFNDRASSVEVRGGRWQLCDDAGFRGRCVTLGAGQYPSLREMGLDRRVSSIREVGGDDRRPDERDNPYGDRGGYRPSAPRAILFSGEGLSGRSLVIDAPGIDNLGSTGFNDRAQSLRVESGDWVFCSDANFQGSCRTYGPGDYPSLPQGQFRAISSARPVAGGPPPYAGGPRGDDPPR